MKSTEEKFTLTEAFAYEEDYSRDSQKAARCCSFLLRYATQGGNAPLDGMISEGIAHALDQLAVNLAKLARRTALDVAKR